MQQHLARIGAVAALGGAVTLFVGTMLHPMGADPNDPWRSASSLAEPRESA